MGAGIGRVRGMEVRLDKVGATVAEGACSFNYSWIVTLGDALGSQALAIGTGCQTLGCQALVCPAQR